MTTKQPSSDQPTSGTSEDPTPAETPEETQRHLEDEKARQKRVREKAEKDAEEADRRAYTGEKPEKQKSAGTAAGEANVSAHTAKK